MSFNNDWDGNSKVWYGLTNEDDDGVGVIGIETGLELGITGRDIKDLDSEALGIALSVNIGMEYKDDGNDFGKNEFGMFCAVVDIETGLELGIPDIDAKDLDSEVLGNALPVSKG